MAEGNTTFWNKIKSGFENIRNKIPKPTKKLFWLWVVYQAVKGTLTTTFIWAPLLWAWLHSGQ